MDAPVSLRAKLYLTGFPLACRSDGACSLGVCPLVASQMFEEATAPTESHSTLFALEGLLASVDSLMLTEMRLQTEAPSTLIALMGFPAGADFLWLSSVRTLAGAVPACITFLGFLCRVSSVVLYEVGRVTKGFPTGIALVRRLLLL